MKNKYIRKRLSQHILLTVRLGRHMKRNSLKTCVKLYTCVKLCINSINPFILSMIIGDQYSIFKDSNFPGTGLCGPILDWRRQGDSKAGANAEESRPHLLPIESRPLLSLLRLLR